MDPGLDWTRLWTELDWTGLFFRGVIFFFGGGGVGAVVLFFLVRKKWRFQPFPQQAIFFPQEWIGINKKHHLFLLRTNQPMGWALFSALLNGV